MIWALAVVLIWGNATRNLVLAIPADALIWAGWVYVNPYTNCGWCKGSGKHRFSTKKTFGNCWNPRCTRGTVQRAGSKTVHRAIRGLVTYRRNRKDK